MSGGNYDWMGTTFIDAFFLLKPANFKEWIILKQQWPQHTQTTGVMYDYAIFF